MLPFFINYRIDLDLTKNTLGTTNNTAATIKAADIKDLHQELYKELAFINKRIIYYANR